MTGRPLPNSSLILMGAFARKDSRSRRKPAASGEELPEACPAPAGGELLQIQPAREALPVAEPGREEQVADLAERHQLHLDLLRALETLAHRLEVFAQIEVADLVADALVR